MQRDLSRLLSPRKVAIVGASADPKKVANRGIRFMKARGFAGEVIGVNPVAATSGVEGMVASIDDLPEGVDVAVLSVPADQILPSVAACARKGIGFAIVFANGFADVGNFDLQARLVEAASEGGMRLVGPNCLGVLDLGNAFAGTFSSLLDRNLLRHGPIALVSQSGAVGNSLLLTFQAIDVGISCWMATGNEADIDAIEALEYVLTRDDTEVAIGILEAVHHAGGRLKRLGQASRASGKPVLVMKSGQSEASKRAAASHTGKVVGNNEAWRQVIAGLGLLEVQSLEHIADASIALGVCRWRQVGSVAVLCGSGGTGGIISDDLTLNGIDLAALSAQTRAALKAILPSGASTSNPVDPTTVTEEVYYKAADLLIEDDAVQTLVLAVNSLARGYADMPDRLEGLRHAAASRGKNIAVTYFSPYDALPQTAESKLRSAGLLLLPTSARLARAMGTVKNWERLSAPARPEVAKAAPRAGDTDKTALSLLDLKDLLAEFGIPVVPTIDVVTVDHALAAKPNADGAIVLKLEASRIAHKTDAGLVRVGLKSAQEISSEIERLSGLQKQYGGRVVAQPLIEDGLEVVIGGLHDPELGPVVTVGLGGIFVEIVREVSIAACPIDEQEAMALLGRGRLGEMLKGFRGARPRNVAALGRAVSGVSRLLVANPQIQEFELNPVLVQSEAENVWAVDALATESTSG